MDHSDRSREAIVAAVFKNGRVLSMHPRAKLPPSLCAALVVCLRSRTFPGGKLPPGSAQA